MAQVYKYTRARVQIRKDVFCIEICGKLRKNAGEVAEARG